MNSNDRLRINTPNIVHETINGETVLINTAGGDIVFPLDKIYL